MMSEKAIRAWRNDLFDQIKKNQNDPHWYYFIDITREHQKTLSILDRILQDGLSYERDEYDF